MPNAVRGSYKRKDFRIANCTCVSAKTGSYMMLSGKVLAIKKQSNSGAAITDIFELIN